MAAGSLRQRRRLLPWFMVAVSLTAFSFDGFLLPAYGKDSAYFSSFYDLKKADLAVETADRMNAPSAPDVQAPRVETPAELVIPPEAASSLDKMSEYLRSKSTARQQATTQKAPEKRPAKIADAVYSAEATDSDTFKWLADRFGASVAALNNRVSSFLWLMGLSFLLVTPWLCLFLLPLFYYNQIVAGLVNERTVFQETRTNWQQFVDRVRSSSFVAFDPLSYNKVREADHLFLGIEPSANFPVLLDQKLLSEHTYIVGDSGSGKTSLGIMPIVKQLMNESATNSEKTPFLILDLKGDNALFQMVREIAAKRAQKFLFFTPEKDRASHHFNPFEDFDLSTRTLSSFCTLFLDALSLNHGEGYGRGYFTARNRLLLYSVLQEHNPQSFAQLNDELAKLRGPAREEAFELVAAMQMLGSYENLNTFGPDRTRMPAERTIQMRRLIEKQEVAYFWLPAAIESISVREIGKLALFSLISAAITRQRAGLPVQRVYVVIDEFQRLAGENFSIVLEQARSFGISLILANQTISDLNTPSKDLRPSIRTNTRVKFFFSVTEPEELRSISSVSGLELVETRTRSTTAGHKGFFASNTETESRTEQFAPRLAAQDIQRVSDHPSEFLLQVSRGSGFTQFAGLPVPVRTEWPMSESEYKRLSSLPWPELPATSQERTREGLSAEMVPVKERDRAFLAEAETWKARIAADAFGYAEIRFVDPPSADPAQEKREATLRNLFEEGERP